MIEVQASDGVDLPLLPKLTAAHNTSIPGSSQTLALSPSAIPALTSLSTSSTAVNPDVAATQSATVVTNDTTSAAGVPYLLTSGEGCAKRSWIFRGRIAAYLHGRSCYPSGTLTPAGELVPDSDASSQSESISQTATSTEPQAAKDFQQTDSPQADSQQTDSPQADSQLTTSTVAPAATNSPVVVEGQTVPADGEPITVSSQVVKLSSGSIYVGSSATPIPTAEAAQSPAEAIVAGTLTFHPASSSLISQVAPSPVVVGGLKFSVAQSESSDEPNTASDTEPESSNEPNTAPDAESKSSNEPNTASDQSQPVVVGGKTYAPISPTLNTEISEADSKPIVVGGITYTPVAASPTPSPQSAAVFSFDGTAITQGGKAVTVSGTRISLGPSGVVMGTSSIPFLTSAPTTSPSLLAIGSEELTALPSGEEGYEIDHSTLLPGSSAVTISGTRYSINAAGSLIVGTSTVPLATAGPSDTSNGALTAGGETFTPLGSTAAVVEGTTLSIGGPAITEDGTRLSLATNGFIVGSSTFAYATPAAATAATGSTSSGTFSTSVLPSSVAIPTSTPSATGGTRKSAASAKTITSRMVAIYFGISISLSTMIGILW